jgi:hypothetical protein
MLDVNNVNFNTLPKIEKMKNLKISMKLSQLRTTIKKNGKGKSKQNVLVSSQKHRMRKEEGATVAATPTFSQRAASLFSSTGRTGSVLQRRPKSVGKSHKIPQMSYLRRETKRRRFSVI